MNYVSEINKIIGNKYILYIMTFKNEIDFNPLKEHHILLCVKKDNYIIYYYYYQIKVYISDLFMNNAHIYIYVLQ